MLSVDFSLPHLHWGSLLFLFKDQCAIYFSLKVHLLNPQCLSSKTVLHRVINPHGVPLKANDIL